MCDRRSPLKSALKTNNTCKDSRFSPLCRWIESGCFFSHGSWFQTYSSIAFTAFTTFHNVALFCFFVANNLYFLLAHIMSQQTNASRSSSDVFSMARSISLQHIHWHVNMFCICSARPQLYDFMAWRCVHILPPWTASPSPSMATQCWQQQQGGGAVSRDRINVVYFPTTLFFSISFFHAQLWFNSPISIQANTQRHLPKWCLNKGLFNGNI